MRMQINLDTGKSIDNDKLVRECTQTKLGSDISECKCLLIES